MGKAVLAGSGFRVEESCLWGLVTALVSGFVVFGVWALEPRAFRIFAAAEASSQPNC